jgi:hypothetical protein
LLEKMNPLTEVLMIEKKREYKQYPEAFQKDAVALVLDQQYTPLQFKLIWICITNMRTQTMAVIKHRDVI